MYLLALPGSYVSISVIILIFTCLPPMYLPASRISTPIIILIFYLPASHVSTPIMILIFYSSASSIHTPVLIFYLPASYIHTSVVIHQHTPAMMFHLLIFRYLLQS